MADVHARLPDLEDAPAEFTLLRSCAGVCKVTHLLRATGPDISEDALTAFDDTVTGTLRRILAGDAPPASQLQASLATCQGGRASRLRSS